MSSEPKLSSTMFIVRHYIGGGHCHEVKLNMLGGYQQCDCVVVIYVAGGGGEEPSGGGNLTGGGDELQPVAANRRQVGVLLLQRNGIVREATGSRYSIDLEADDLERFLMLPDHYQFLMNKRWWRKLPNDQLVARLRRLHLRTYRY